MKKNILFPEQRYLNQLGYTLIEIIVALAVFAVVSTITATVIVNVQNQYKRAEQHLADLQALQSAMAIMARDFEQVQNRPSLNQTKNLEPAFNTNVDTQSYSMIVEISRSGYNHWAGQIKRSQLQRVIYRQQADQLQRESITSIDSIDLVTKAGAIRNISRTLLHGVKNLEWRFYDQQGRAFDYWPPTTSLAATLPRSVSIKINFLNGQSIKRFFLLAPHEVTQ